MQALPIVNQAPQASRLVSKTDSQTSGKEFLPMLDKAAKNQDDADLAGAAMVGDVPTANVAEKATAGVESSVAVESRESSEGNVVGSGASDDVVAQLIAGESAVQSAVEDEQPVVPPSTMVTENAVQSTATEVSAALATATGTLATGAEAVEGGKQAGRTPAAAVQAQQPNVDAADVDLAVEQAVATQVKNEVTSPGVIKGEVVQVVSDDVLQQVKDPLAAPIVVIEDLEVETPQADKKVTDPLFASLLNKPDMETALRQRQAPVTAETVVAAPVVSDGNVAVSSAVEGGEAVVPQMVKGDEHSSSAEALLSRPAVDVSQAPLHAAPAAQSHAATNSAVNFDDSVISLRNGVSVPESRVVDQTLEHLTVHARGDSSAVTVKLHPEELGELQLRMVMEGDQLKVHLQAQNQQVQDVLERNFPRLRDALQDQGLTVEDFQVSVDSGSQQQQQSTAGEQGSSWATETLFSSADDGVADAVADVAHVATNDVSRGISVRI